MIEEVKSKKPKGGRKGGTRFPQISLKDAVEYAKKLASKTHTGPQPAGIILPGVFGSATQTGQIRASAMKQFGLMDGLAEAYSASELAKKIIAATPEDIQPLLQAAALKPEVFLSLYQTFVGDKVSSAKIRQQTLKLEVHPDNADKCVSLFMESAQHAGLGQIDGDDIAFSSVANGRPSALADNGSLNVPTDVTSDASSSELQADASMQSPTSRKASSDVKARAEHTPSGRSVIHVNIDLDSSLDTEKLERQLELLRRFGAI